MLKQQSFLKKQRTGLLNTLCTVMAIVAFVGILGYQVWKMEQFLTVYQNPLTVSATVVKHGEKHNDDDTDYISYISYTVDGVKYSNVEYETENALTNLDPIGTEVEVMVSPKNPGVTLWSLLKQGYGITFVLPLSLEMLAATWRKWNHNKRTCYGSSTPDSETIRRDVMLTLRGRSLPTFALLTGAGFLALYLRYSVIYGTTILIISIVCFAFWLVMLIFALQALRQVKAGDYRLLRDELIDKRIVSDSESADSYILCFQSKEKSWEKQVTELQYNCAKIGDSVLGVYLPNRKKPIIFYTLGGQACSR